MISRDELEAIQKNVRILLHLSRINYFGLGVPQDYSRTKMWLERAAAHNSSKAQYGLGLLYSYGRGVEQDKEKAKEWFRIAQKNGHPNKNSLH